MSTEPSNSHPPSSCPWFRDPKKLTYVCCLGVLLHFSVLYFIKELDMGFSRAESGEHVADSGIEDELDRYNEEIETFFEEVFNPETIEEVAEKAPLEEEWEEDWEDLSAVVNDFAEQPIDPVDITTELKEFVNADQLPDLPSLFAEATAPSVQVESAAITHHPLASTLFKETDALQQFASADSLPDVAQGHEAAGAIASTDHFNIKVSYSKENKSNGYVFKAEFVAKRGVRFKRIAHNVFFLIDRSFSIAKDRYEQSKKAVLQALSFLEEGDTFNILVFDKKVVRMADGTIAWNAENCERASRFLSQQKHGGLFASTDLYTSLDKIIPKSVADTEVNTAILLSDGETALSQQEQRRSINVWTKRNGGKVTLFSVTAGTGNNVPLLRLLTHFNRGSQAHTGQHRDIGHELCAVMQKIKTPIGKEIIATAVQKGGGNRVELYPRNAHMPNLYEGECFTLYGRIERLESFYLFLQGKYYDQWLDIKKQVDFSDASHVRQELQKEVALYDAYDDYGDYLKWGKLTHITEAERKLAPFDIPPAF